MSAALFRSVTLFNVTFPHAVLFSVSYTAVSDVLFSLNKCVGARLNQRLRRAARAGFVLGSTGGAAALHFALLATCAKGNLCSPNAPLFRRECFLAAATALVSVCIARVVDRFAVPLLEIEKRRSFDVGFLSRVCHSAVLCVAWMCMGEAETLGVLLLLGVTARRALSAFSFVGKIYTAVLKLYTLLHVSWVLTNRCAAGSQKSAVAGAMAMVLV
tara:strand:- start:48 stop:692 length:645 start_codon:yes stop_codon:yes gene_type:complete